MKPQYLFATLVVCQAAHSLEETVGGLYDLLPYISWMDGVVPGGAFVFFVTVNTLFVLFGCWCYFGRVRTAAPSAGFFVTLWAVIEILNGIAHPGWSLLAGVYIPGTLTAPVLLVVALLLLWRWRVAGHMAGS
ncbi:MAG: HXXEE domain-containing protein [Gammaproteobacteria bacterium]|nr:HXXEE domain-containing protein [Gammaproteobacteria bacterium]